MPNVYEQIKSKLKETYELEDEIIEEYAGLIEQVMDMCVLPHGESIDEVSLDLETAKLIKEFAKIEGNLKIEESTEE